MNSGMRACQNCKNQFAIDQDDFKFYEKIKVPPPTWCSECRLIRKMVWRNERVLYKRKCDATKQDIISIYSPDKPYTVYEQKYWWSDSWDPLSYGQEVDFRRPFFDQFRELVLNVPWPNLVATNSLNSDYCHSVLNVKNSYLIFGAVEMENCAYGANVDFSRDCFDIKNSVNNELCYELVVCRDCFRVIFSEFCDQCSESAFLSDCRGCFNCFGCVGLRNKSYYIFNEPHSKEEYFERLKGFDLSSYEKLTKVKEDFERFKIRYPYKYARIYNSTNATGDNIRNAKNSFECFDVQGYGIENSRYTSMVYGQPSSYCQSVHQIGGGEMSYDSISIRQCSNVFFSKKIWTGHDVTYSHNCSNSNYLFGCVGLRNKQYCILNKQYTTEEYEGLIPRVIEHMNSMPYIDKSGRICKYGEFFPSDFSPFAYNETIAQECFPLTREEAVGQGYEWKDPELRNYEVALKSENLPSHIKEVGDAILDKVIGCVHNGKCNEQCTTAFKIIPMELQFYRKMNLPLPRFCPNCRHYQRLKQRNPLKLWHRKCMCDPSTDSARSGQVIYKNTSNHFHGNVRCPNEFETSYALERPEIVYCESCYNSEVV